MEQTPSLNIHDARNTPAAEGDACPTPWNNVDCLPSPPCLVSSPEPRVPNRPTCRQCRARKVKCDRVDPTCGACTRLDLVCSFSRTAGADVTFASPDNTSSFDPTLTEAGTKRRRIRRACEHCRATKTRCSGNSPCARCRIRGLSCDNARTQAASSRAPGHDRPGASPIPDRQVLNANSACGKTTPGDATSVMKLDPAVVRRYIEAYFDYATPLSCIFLHRPSVLADWSQGKLDPVLAQAISGIGFLLLCDESPSNLSGEEPSSAHDWMSEVQQRLLARISRISLAQLQALILVVQYRFRHGDRSDAWNLLPVASRLAFTMRLNYELPNPEPIVQESRRRTVWAVWLMDRIFSGGNVDLTVCPKEAIHIRLPCSDYGFQRGIASVTPKLESPTSLVDSASMDIVSYYILLLDIRDRILRYGSWHRRDRVY